MVKPAMIPYGLRSDGAYGLLLNSSEQPLVSVCEVLSSLPAAGDTDNFPGRLVFDTSTLNMYVFNDTPSDEWIELRNAAVEVDTGDPPGSGMATGDLFYSTTTLILYVYDGTDWTPVGGERGAEVIWRHYTGDGATSLFETGATTLPPVEYVQVFLNGVAQQPGTSVTRDYYMVGNRVQLNSVPGVGVEISIRTLTFINFARNSVLVTNRHVADGIDNSFDTGILSADPSQVFVYVDGVMQMPDTGAGAGTYDYDIITQDLSVVSLTSVGTTATLTTTAAHQLLVGQTVTITGALQAAYNGSFTVVTTPTSTTLTYTMGSSTTSPATPNPTITFGPATVNDYVRFVNSSGTPTAPESGAIIQIRAVDNIVVGDVEGEINAGANLGAGSGIYAGKSGVNLQFKSLVAGNRINLTASGSEITIDNEDNFVSYTAWNGTPSTYVVTSTDYYIGVRNSAGIPVSIDISTNIPAIPANTGRRLIIKDEARNAGTHQISVVPSGSIAINGAAPGAAYAMTTNGASVTMVFDGANWHIIGSTTS